MNKKLTEQEKKEIKKQKDKLYREANKEKAKAWRDANKEKIKLNNQSWRIENKEYKSKLDKEYKKINHDKLKQQNKEYYIKNKEKIINYRIENKEKIKHQRKLHYKKNNVILKAKAKDYKIKNKSKIDLKRKIYLKQKYTNDPFFKLTVCSRNLINKAIKRNGYTKKSKTIDILGCSFIEFKQYLESKFEPWMNWDNYGKYDGTEHYGWDIDHIIPLATAINENDIINLNHYTNLQPLCSFINRDIKKDNPNF